MKVSFIASIHKAPDSDWGVSFPDVPRVVTAACDLEEARLNAIEALAFHLRGMEVLPQPSTFSDIAAIPANKDAVGFMLITVDVENEHFELIKQFRKSLKLNRKFLKAAGSE